MNFLVVPSQSYFYTQIGANSRKWCGSCGRAARHFWGYSISLSRRPQFGRARLFPRRRSHGSDCHSCDCWWEEAARKVRNKPFSCVFLCYWAVTGRTAFKNKIPLLDIRLTGPRRWWASLIKLVKTFFFPSPSLCCSYEAPTSGSFCGDGKWSRRRRQEWQAGPVLMV